LEKANLEGKPSSFGTVAFQVGGEVFCLPRPLLMVLSPHWAARLGAEPDLSTVDLPGEAASFRAFVDIVSCTDVASSEITAENVLHVLRWSKEFGMDHIVATCESFFLTCNEALFPPLQLLEVAAQYDMPLLYARAVERAAQSTHHLVVPDTTSEIGQQQPSAFASEHLRGDIVASHVAMSVMRGHGEMRCKHRFADHTRLDDASQRARLLWKTRQQFVKAPLEPFGHDWRTLQTVWPHHTLRGSDWVAAPCEMQPSRGKSALAMGAAGLGRSSLASHRVLSHRFHMD